MFNPEFDPYDQLVAMQDTINQLLVDQQQLAKNVHYLYQTLVSHQKQLQSLTQLDALFNTKLDLIRQDLAEQIAQVKHPE